jgi:hypothetical protein
VVAGSLRLVPAVTAWSADAAAPGPLRDPPYGTQAVRDGAAAIEVGERVAVGSQRALEQAGSVSFSCDDPEARPPTKSPR